MDTDLRSHPTLFFFVWLKHRRIFLRVLVNGLLLPMLVLALLPGLSSCVPGSSLAVEPWGHVYHTAYTALVIDDNYGYVLIFQCDRTGIFCQQVHRFYTDIISKDSLELTYRLEQDRFSISLGSRVIYVRSQQKSICALDRVDLLNKSCSVKL